MAKAIDLDPAYGSAQALEVRCADGWKIVYTTTRSFRRPTYDKYVVLRLKPSGRGARSDPKEWTVSGCQTYRSSTATRNAARRLIEQHGGEATT